MGYELHYVCHDCKERIDLDKHYSLKRYDIEHINGIEKQDLEEFGESFVYRTLRQNAFLTSHNGHRVEYMEDYKLDQHEASDYKEVGFWPEWVNDSYDEVDFTDPDASRLVIKTIYGEICMDIRPDGVNCWRWIDGKRIDTLILPK